MSDIELSDSEGSEDGGENKMTDMLASYYGIQAPSDTGPSSSAASASGGGSQGGQAELFGRKTPAASDAAAAPPAMAPVGVPQWQIDSPEFDATQYVGGGAAVTGGVFWITADD